MEHFSSMVRSIPFVRVLLIVFVVFGYSTAFALDLNQNSLDDSTESEVVVTTSQTIPSGEYIFQSLVVTNNAIVTAESNPDSSSDFKGVHIVAQSLRIDENARITTGATGHQFGPGYRAGYAPSHGASTNREHPEWQYGDPFHPVDLGSGVGGSRRGAGVLKLTISGTLHNNGSIDANAVHNLTTGGSVYITTNTLTGTGSISAKGGNVPWPGRGSGAGGRVAVYYQQSTYTGGVSALAGDYCFYGCIPDADPGTALMVDTTSNNLILPSTFVFQSSQSPYSYNEIRIIRPTSYTGAGRVVIEPDTTLIANRLIVQNSELETRQNNTLTIPLVVMDSRSTLTVTGNDVLKLDSLDLNNSSKITTPVEHKLMLELNSIRIDPTSAIDLTGKGYLDNGPGSMSVNGIGASYGGRGAGGGLNPYGNDLEPDDFGSGTPSRRGGGYARITARDLVLVDGQLSVNGDYPYASGGGVYITTNKLAGSGNITANAQNQRWPQQYPGGGGRVAVYYNENTFAGAATAFGGEYCYDGCTPAGQDGTVVIKQKPDPNAPSNVMFVPGHMASRLYEDLGECTTLINPCGEKQLWFSINNNLQSRMSLDTNGDSVNPVYTIDDTQHETPNQDETGILDEVFGINIYKSFLTDMQSWKDDGVVNDYEFIPYDWRLSIEDVVANGRATNGKVRYTNDQSFGESYILHKLRDLQRTSKSGKVTIITHSNGGLVAKALIKKLKETNDPLYNQIDQLILVASPQIGTPEAAIALLHGTELQNGFVMSAERSRALAENMTSAYTLLPSQAYYTSVFGDMFTFPNDSLYASERTRYAEGVSTFTELQDYMKGVEGRTNPSVDDVNSPNISNVNLLDQANVTHGIIDFDPLPPTTQVIQIAGWGLETLAGLDYTVKHNKDGTTSKTFNPRHTIDGDGTVVEPSALWIPESERAERWWVNMIEANKGKLIKLNHKSITEVPELRVFLHNKVSKLPTYVDPNNTLTEYRPVSNLAARLNFILHSPLTLGIRDPNGNYSGRNPDTGQIDQSVPDVNYQQIGEVQFLSVPDDASYTVELDGQGAGSFSLDIQRVQGNTLLDTTTYQAIPTTPDTQVVIPIAPSQNIDTTQLIIDSNSDGITDVILPANPSGTTFYDTEPPELQVSFDTDKFDVAVTATDKIDAYPKVATTALDITATDSAGNTTIIPLKRYRDDAKRFRIVYDSISRNGVTTPVPQTSITYTWNMNKKGILTDLNTRLSIKGVEKYVYDYNRPTNTTRITNKTKHNVTRTTYPGMLYPTVTTEGKSVVVKY